MNKIWHSRGLLARLLTPVAALLRVVVLVRSKLYKVGLLKSTSSEVPVIVVGNISVGGTGKTPIVSALVHKLQSAGFRPGIVSRGYGATPAKEPRPVTPDMPIELAGDEPSMLSRETGVPVCICIDRPAAVAYLAQKADVNVIISDDGLQHYAMSRDIEIAVIDGQRLLGNGWLLPAGPLREPASRLNSVDVIAVQQTPMTTQADQANALNSLGLNRGNNAGAGSFYLNIVSVIKLQSDATQALSSFENRRVHAVAGVGNPQRFFTSLLNANLDVIEHAMSDHHKYVPEDLQFDDNLPILMTTKDAVKVRELGIDLANMYEVSVVAVLDRELNNAIDQVLRTLQ